MTRKLLFTGGLAAFAFLIAGASPASSETPTGSWRIEANTGFTARTSAGNVFSMGAGLDYLVSPRISVGPMASVNSGVDLTHYLVSGVARYEAFSRGNVRVFPMAGLGFIHADYRGATTTAVLVPMGVSADYRIDENVFSISVIGNLHPVDLPSVGVKDPKTVSVYFGIRHDL